MYSFQYFHMVNFKLISNKWTVICLPVIDTAPAKTKMKIFERKVKFGQKVPTSPPESQLCVCPTKN